MFYITCLAHEILRVFEQVQKTILIVHGLKSTVTKTF